ncbi:MAG: hypothetical protein HONBIEJF_03054 [Fimbriimonadaceae bacterium]|nr:hypothetical protein [Fimbriimonadaceae bacterium]
MGIGIDFKNMADPIIKLYRNGEHIAEGAVPWQQIFSGLL